MMSCVQAGRSLRVPTLHWRYFFCLILLVMTILNDRTGTLQRWNIVAGVQKKASSVMHSVISLLFLPLAHWMAGLKEVYFGGSISIACPADISEL